MQACQVVCVDEAASIGVYGLVVGVDVEQHHDSTLPCGSPFRCRRQRLFFPFSTTKKRLLSSVVRIRSFRCTSPVIFRILLRRRRWLTCRRMQTSPLRQHRRSGASRSHLRCAPSGSVASSYTIFPVEIRLVLE